MSCQRQEAANTAPNQGHLTVDATANRRERRVTFKPTATVQPIDCSMSGEEISRSYYNREELNALPLSKALPGKRRHGGTAEGDCLVRLDADPALRGLELRSCPVRARNKALAERAVLRYHDRLKAGSAKTGEEKLLSLAAASAGLSRWSRSVALETARLDALRARGEGYPIPVFGDPFPIPPFPFRASAKSRRVTLDEEESSTA